MGKNQKQKSKRVCFVTGKKTVTGGKITHRGISKKSKGIGLQLVKNVKRKFKPNLQKIRTILPNGSIKHVWVSAKALKAGLVTKYVRTKRPATTTK